jgi:proteasome lid subunit RPN8/RPN11
MGAALYAVSFLCRRLLHMQIPENLFDRMMNHLQAVYPEEGCGFLAGRAGRVTAVYPIENHLHSITAFTMAPDAQLAALQAIDAAGLSLLAIFHSHPHSAPTPSPTDIAQAYYPDAALLIVSLADRLQPKWGVYRVSHGVVRPLSAEIIA